MRRASVLLARGPVKWRPLAGPEGVLMAPESVSLTNLRDVPGSRKVKRRLGRGQASGRGGQSGKGHKGHKARSGAKIPPLFEGGQATLALRVRKYGFTNKMFREELDELGLDRLQRFIDQGRLDATQRLTLKVLKDAGLVTRIRHGLKLLGNGADTFRAKVDIEATAVSAKARDAIVKAGGTVTTVYFNRLGLLTHLRNEPADVKIRFARAPPQKWSRFDVPKYPSPVDALYAQMEELEKQKAPTSPAKQ